MVGSPNWSSTVTFTRTDATGRKSKDMEGKRNHDITSVASSGQRLAMVATAGKDVLRARTPYEPEAGGVIAVCRNEDCSSSNDEQ